jgi:drug/metabolite transporter (DMT)-like permease
MSPEVRWLAAFAGVLAVVGAVMFLFTTSFLPHALMWGSAVAVALLAMLLWRRPAPDAPQRLPETSVGTVVLVFGAGTMLAGAPFGLWITLLGIEISAVGVFLLVREHRRRA